MHPTPLTRAELAKHGIPHQRYHFVGYRQTDGEPLFDKTAEITVRSLKSVGGIRAGAKHTKRANRAARKLGFPSHQAYVERMTQLAIKASSLGLRPL